MTETMNTKPDAGKVVDRRVVTRGRWDGEAGLVIDPAGDGNKITVTELRAVVVLDGETTRTRWTPIYEQHADRWFPGHLNWYAVADARPDIAMDKAESRAAAKKWGRPAGVDIKKGIGKVRGVPGASDFPALPAESWWEVR